MFRITIDEEDYDVDPATHEMYQKIMNQEDSLEQTLNKFKGIQEWNKETIESFLNELVVVPLNEYETTEKISVDQLKQTRDPKYKDLNPRLFKDFDKATTNFQNYAPAESEGVQWKKDKFDLEQAKHIQKYLMSLKQKGET